MDQPSSPPNTAARWLRPSVIRLSAIGVLVGLVLRLWLLRNRKFDADEFQHLHGAYSIFHGLIPYRDYFEHHAPALHLLLVPGLLITDNSPDALFIARGLIFLIGIGVLAVTYWLGTLWGGVRVGALAMLLLSMTNAWTDKVIEIRPESAASALVVLAVCTYMLGVRTGRRSWWFACGVAVGCALMFNQKAVFAAIGLTGAAAWLCVADSTRLRGRCGAHHAASAIVGALLPVGAVVGYFAAQNALSEFLRSTVLANLHLVNVRWKSGMPVTRSFFYWLQWDAGTAALGLAGLCVAAAGLRSLDARGRGEAAPVLVCAALLLGIRLMPVIWLQYYLLFLPFLAVFGAGLLMQLIGPAPVRRQVRVATASALVAAVLTALALQGRTALRSGLTTLPGVPFAVLCPAAVAALWARWRRHAVLVLMVALALLPVSKAIRTGTFNNAKQLTAISHVLANSSPSDAVFDGWSGYGVLRPHAYYYFFLHYELQANLSEEQRGRDVVAALERRRPKFVVHDDPVRNLPAVVQEYILGHYRSSPVPPILERVR
jgi:4-amino-4-deoxy-L-arabinose transferase-like glycosyltransferase